MTEWFCNRLTCDKKWIVEVDPCVNYKTVLLKMQVFVVLTGSEFWGNKTKDIYLLMNELQGDSYCFISQWSV